MNNWLVSQEGILLRQQAEIVFGKPILYSYECESLSNQIKITTGLDISAQTLRRMWGFIKDGVAISKRSEQIVLKYVGIDEIKTLLKIKSKDTLITSEEKVLADFMKQFYEVESVNEDDINYQIANYKIFIKVISSEAMLAYLGPYFAKHPIAQVYFFEKAPYFDGICGSYQLYFKMYLKHKNTAEAQLIGNCVLHFASFMQENIKEGEALLKKINQIDENLSSHAFPVARKVMANLTQGYLKKDQQQIETWTKIAFQWHNKIKPANKRESYFPFYPFVVADAFNLIGDYEMALQMIEIGELDYMRFKDIPFNNGFYESLDIIKAIALYGTGKKDHAKRILARIDEANLSFLTRKYFIIQKKIIELALCSQTTSKKFVNIKTEVNDLIKATDFVFFKQILKRFSL